MDTGLVVFLFLLAAAAGWVFGVRAERQSWVIRAMPDGSTPHHCGGRFYFVIEEGYFCREFCRRVKLPPDPPIRTRKETP